MTYGSISISVPSSARHLRPGLESPRTPFARRQGQGGPARSGQPSLSQRGFLDSAHRRPLAGPAPDYGDWKNTHRRYSRWRDNGVWAQLLEAVTDEPDFEWLMIDASHIKAHPHAAGAVGGNQAMARTKGG